MSAAPDHAASEQPALELRLYVAGDATHSRLARERLQALCAAHPERAYRIEIVDVLREPEHALEHGVFITPALEIRGPGGPEAMIYGNLSDSAALSPFFPAAAQDAS
ncbi:MAG: circadian clock KaiB family protein [Planctomycetota bacterium]